MIIYAMRHGETDYNLHKRIQGWSDIRLNQKGVQQTELATEQFVAPIKALFCSDLLRTQESIRSLKTKYSHYPVLLDWRLRERNFGSLEGEYHSDDDMIGNNFYNRIGQVEDVEKLIFFKQRVVSFLNDLMAYFDRSDSVFVSTHGGTINQLNHIINGSTEYIFYNNAQIVKFELHSFITSPRYDQ